MLVVVQWYRVLPANTDLSDGKLSKFLKGNANLTNRKDIKNSLKTPNTHLSIPVRNKALTYVNILSSFKCFLHLNTHTPFLLLSHHLFLLRQTMHGSRMKEIKGSEKKNLQQKVQAE